MKITALVENKAKPGFKANHGLSLYIETENHKILFDLGPDNTVFENAKFKNIDLSEVDTVIISHGHMDHGGALSNFLQVNSHAKIYVQRKAFQPHHSKLLFLKVNVGLDNKLEKHPQVILVDGDYKIDEELSLFTVSDICKCYSHANDMLYQNGQKDNFSHEHNLVINEKQTAVIMGCGHAGVVNIMEKAIEYNPQLFIGGYHLYNPFKKKDVSKKLLDDIALELRKYNDIEFYTCHCTGEEAFNYFATNLPNMHYLSCGEEIIY